MLISFSIYILKEANQSFTHIHTYTLYHKDHVISEM